MTVLDNPRRSDDASEDGRGNGPVDAREAPQAAPLAPRDVQKAARSLENKVGRFVRVAIVSAGILLALGALGVLLREPALLLSWPAALLMLALARAGGEARSRAEEPVAGIPLHVLTEAALHHHVGEVAAVLGTRSPTEIRLVPQAEVWLVPDPEGPLLHIGAPLLWHLSVDELDRLVAPELAKMVVVLDPELRPALELVARLDIERLTSDRSPLVGFLVRRWGRQVAASRDAMMRLVREYALAQVPDELRPTDADRAELAALAEVADMIGRQRRQAAAHGVGVRPVGARTDAVLAAAERLGMIDARPDRMASRTPAISLLSAPETVDERLCRVLASETVGPEAPVIGWDALPFEVSMPLWRAERDEMLPAIAHLTGTRPHNLRGLVAALGRADDPAYAPDTEAADQDPSDPVTALGALLSRHPLPVDSFTDGAGDDGADRHANRRRDAVTRALTAAVRVATVEQELLGLGWDDAWGAVVLDGGQAVMLEPFVGDAVDRRAAEDLTGWLERLGVDVDREWAGAVSPGQQREASGDDLPLHTVTARYRRRGLDQTVDVVFMDGWLLGYPHRRFRRGHGARRGAAELRELASTHRADLVAVADPDSSARLSDVLSAQASGSALGTGWRLDLELPNRRLVLTGKGPGRVVADALAPALGSRLTRTGTARDDRPDRSRAATVWWLVGRASAAATLAIAVLVGVGGPELSWLAAGDPTDGVLTVVAAGLLLTVAAERGLAGATRRFERPAGRPRVTTPRPAGTRRL